LPGFTWATIGIRIAILIRTPHYLPATTAVHDRDISPRLARAIDITQIGNLIFSLSANLLATGTMGLKVWYALSRMQTLDMADE
jgi:hypothetical protein